MARIPAPPDGYFDTLEAQFARFTERPADLAAALRAEFEPEPLPYERTVDFGLRYFTADDVRS